MFYCWTGAKMSLNTTLTGSLPPPDSVAEATLAKAVRDAVKMQLNSHLDVIVDGQFRGDIVRIFANSIGLEGAGLPYLVTQRLGKLQSPVTLTDLKLAAGAADGHPLKAHITGPTVIAESCEFKKAPHVYQGESGYETLTLDLATALAEEAKWIAQQSKELNIQYLQIDEPSLAYGADLRLARMAVGIIADAWRQHGGGSVILHVCGDMADILLDLIQMPVDILNIENVHLREAAPDKLNVLRVSGMKLALGVVPVNSSGIPTPRRVARELIYAGEQYGDNHLWGVTPNCGLRLSEESLVVGRLNCLTQAVKLVDELMNRDPGRGK